MGPIKAINSRLVRSHFSAHAAEYDRYADVQKRVVAHLTRLLEPEGAISGPILDVGTGTGVLASAVSRRWPGETMVVMDIAHGMTRAASERLPEVMPCDGDARSLPFSGQAFGLVMSSSVYQWVEQLPRAFDEVFRTLRPGGCFALALFGERTLQELRNSHKKALGELAPERSSHVQNFPGLGEVQAAMSSAGFVVDHASSILEVDFHADVPTLLRQLKHIGASNAAADRPRGLASRNVMQKMIGIYEQEYRLPQGVPATYEVLLLIGSKG